MATKSKTSKNGTSSKTQAMRMALILQGVVAILFGIAAVFWPGLTTLTLVYLLSAFLLVDGIIALISGLIHLAQPIKSLFIVLLGIIEIGLGLYLVSNPEVAFATLIIVLGFALIIRGVFSFVHAFSNKGDSAAYKTMQILLGILGVVIGVIVLAQPVAGGLAFVWVIGLYSLIAGPVLIAMASDLTRN